MKQNMAEFENDMLKAMIDSQRAEFKTREESLLREFVRLRLFNPLGYTLLIKNK